MSTRILHLETSTKVCSVAISKDGAVHDFTDKFNDTYIHGEALTLMIQDLLLRSKLQLNDLHAISYSAGPGSYTGLRIGLSTAKGLCYALGIPLIGLTTHQILFELSKTNSRREKQNVISMLDARRNEVYLEIFNSQGQTLEKLACVLLDEFDTSPFLPAIVVGDANQKAQALWKDDSLEWENAALSARYQSKVAYEAYERKKFEDLAYCAPIYLKGANGILL